MSLIERTRESRCSDLASVCIVLPASISGPGGLIAQLPIFGASMLVVPRPGAGTFTAQFPRFHTLPFDVSIPARPSLTLGRKLAPSADINADPPACRYAPASGWSLTTVSPLMTVDTK